MLTWHHRVVRIRHWHTAVAVTVGVSAVCASCSRSPSTKASPATRANDAACSAITATFDYRNPNYISVQEAVQIEQLLKRANAPGLIHEAGPLQSAITSGNKAQMLSIIGALQEGVCKPLGFTPLT